MTASILSSLTKATSLCLGLLAVAQLSAHASTHMPEMSEHLRSHSLKLLSVADSHAIFNNSELYYVPPNNSRPSSGTNSTSGTRGGSCRSAGTTNEEGANTEFTALGPWSMSGLTTQARPEFGWYISPSEEGAPLLFSLLQVKANGQPSLVYSKEFIAQTGFMEYQLPTEVPSLELGKDYLWQVVVICATDERLLMSTLPIRVVSSSSELTAQLSTATTNAERAIIYGNAGLWYDAFAQVMLSAAPDDEAVRSGLLRDLAASEEEDNQALSSVLLAIIEQTDER